MWCSTSVRRVHTDSRHPSLHILKWCLIPYNCILRMCFCAVAVECYGTLLLSLLESFIRVTDRIVLACLSKWKTCRKFYADLWLIFVFSLCGLSFLCLFFFRTYKYKHHLNANLSFAQARCCQMFTKWINRLHLTLPDSVPIFPPIEWLFINFQFLPHQTFVLSTQMRWCLISLC